MKIYLASSWKNTRYPAILTRLREEGFTVFDFREPSPGCRGFHWSDVDPHYTDWTVKDYLSALNHPPVQPAFSTDMEGLRSADAVVLLMPCGRSAHLELGYAVGCGKRTAILLQDEKIERS